MGRRQDARNARRERAEREERIAHALRGGTDPAKEPPLRGGTEDETTRPPGPRDADKPRNRDRDRAQAQDRDRDQDQDRPTRPVDLDKPDTADEPPPESHLPERPTDLPTSSWFRAAWRTIREFKEDDLNIWAAALTYQSVLSIFPALLVVVSLVGLAGRSATDALTENVQSVAPTETHQIVINAIQNLENSRSAAGPLALAGLGLALWSASGYVAAFMRACNTIYDVPEGRPLWKTVPTRIAVTVVTLVLLSVCAIAVVFTGSLAKQAGHALGVGEAGVLLWDYAKWPVLIVVVNFLFALLYWAAPNAKQGFRWITPGGVLAVLLWALFSAAFAYYVANFSTYNKTYGTLAAVIVFLVWLWLTNMAILLGAEYNAEMERARAIAGGHPPTLEPYVRMRDTPKPKGAWKRWFRFGRTPGNTREGEE
ncbi:YihY/virulence factor BrkB family protein [Embleya sp. NBC_00888]|uniref:YihY/virulence factor BrkB family protein n=1 Tax=Embleya sp. NBC_00888 TaxID=2975960 RepID=UPI0038661192|nr:YihY/virulence factor BrkB family protein [Embleya sp. NBC_00888]